MPNAVLTEAIDQLANGRDLTRPHAAEVLREIMGGSASEIEIAGFLMGLRAKGETVAEVAGLAETMRALAAPVATTRTDLVDTAGTGGGRSTFNISTTAALVAAGAGCAVAKHGNRSATSKSGSADVLEALGARIDLEPSAVGRCIDEAGFGFMFAPAHHASTRYVIPVRQGLAVRTVFNVLGPLTNPAGARRQVIGVVDPSLIDLLAGAVAELGCDHTLVVSSADGLDEMSISAVTHVAEIKGSDVQRYALKPTDVGLPLGPPDVGPGGTPQENAATTRAILMGLGGPETDLILLNAGAAIYVSGRAPDHAAGVELAREAITSGAAVSALDRYVELTQKLAPAA